MTLDGREVENLLDCKQCSGQGAECVSVVVMRVCVKVTCWRNVTESDN